MNDFVTKRLITLLCIMSTVVVLGTTGYALIEDWRLMDGLYMTLITISTVGYGEIQELSFQGRVFTSGLIIVSMISLVYWTAGITSLLVSGDLTGDFRRKREFKMISKLRDHVVVCGGGVMARTVIASLYQQKTNVVALVQEEEQLNQLQRLFPDLLAIHTDPKSELSMADANILNAKYLVAAMESDFDNLLITITGVGLGTNIQIYSCAMNNELAARMLKVGASHVICPMVLGGNQVATMIQEQSTANAGKTMVTAG